MNESSGCPVIEKAERVIELGGKLSSAIRQLRQATKQCEECTKIDECQIWREYNSQVDAAIQAVVDDWGLV